MKPKRDISSEPIRGQKIEVDTDEDLRNGDNRVSLTSDAKAEEHQEISSKNTLDQWRTQKLFMGGFHSAA